MKILYGVQATGNGHITRARAMNKAFQQTDLSVDYLFSGRERDDFFDMEEFGDFNCRAGMTFVTEAGKVNVIETARQNQFRQLFRDIKNLDLSAYDLVLTDFEPITAWAAKKQGKRSVAIGHQYAFDHNIPKRGNNPVTALFMQHFAPASIRLGLHWHHFGCPILPPIADTHEQAITTVDNKIVVYLGFEQQSDILDLITPFSDYDFYVYGKINKAEDRGHIKLCSLSREGFLNDLASCNGVITNAGFELASEAIHLGKKLLVKPLKGQMEQLSNAKALEQLQLGVSMDQLDQKVLKDWLVNFKSKRVIYPSVPDALAQWIQSEDWHNAHKLSETLWSQVESPDLPNFAD